jgi:hypothetical protein
MDGWMVGWMDQFITRHGHEKESALRLDRLGAHRYRDALATLREGHGEAFSLPAQAAKPISSCDNSDFSLWKAWLRAIDPSTMKAKTAALLQ